MKWETTTSGVQAAAQQSGMPCTEAVERDKQKIIAGQNMQSTDFNYKSTGTRHILLPGRKKTLRW